ncbi:MAG: MiaB/RimO family radical SAM methylthiotransferase [Coriobacteriales bacterium]|jgi:threonylcarbamoyladenosine tRNA methylthiotransferase MtaB|nr:MiaB/RimO family radical SAM methylthiotransferase [Coriobacteriales bacterium]
MLPEFFVHNLGCKVNRVESDALSAALLEAGGTWVERDCARVVIINTCTVTGEAEAKTRKAIRQALGTPREPWVIATGCAIAMDKEAYQALGERVIAEPDRLLAQAKALELLGLQESFERGAETPTPAPAPTFRTRKGIKIQDGCDNNCSYCLVRLARGPSRSVPRDAIVEQVCAAEREGIREVVLTGVNVGSYDDGGYVLSQLIADLIPVITKLRIRLSSIEPQHLSDDLLELMASSEGRLCAHLHLPLQSGCDWTLEAMARPYDSAFFAERVERARDLMPRLALTTDVIVGFPGERDEDFEQSMVFCERMGFARMHVFRYSRRPQTPAAEMSGQVAPQVIAQRARTLHALAERMRRRDARARVGSREMVLVEGRGVGTSESYHRVAVCADGAAGELLSMRITGYRDNLLQATL